MARLSDIIEIFIKTMLNETEGGIEIKRNELANHFNCVPSQINYVIGTFVLLVWFPEINLRICS